MSSETARTILAALGDGPAPASDLVDHVDTSLQNVHYHLENLRTVGLVEAVGSWYSTKGTEMTVYGLAAERVEIRLADAVDSDDAGFAAATDDVDDAAVAAATDDDVDDAGFTDGGAPDEAATPPRAEAAESPASAPTRSD